MGSERKCVICTTAFPPKSPSEGDNATSLVFTQDLDSYFVLRTILGIPTDVCAEFLKKYGNPSTWGIFVCPPCKTEFIEVARVKHIQISQLESELKDVRQNVVEKMKRSQLPEEGGDGIPPKKKPKRGRKKKGAPSQVHTDVRAWIFENAGATDKDSGLIQNAIDKQVENAGGVQKLIAKKIVEKAFANVGPGYTLKANNDPKPGSSKTASAASVIVALANVPGSSNFPSEDSGSLEVPSGPTPNIPKTIASEEKRLAAAAALARLEKNKRPETNSKEFLAARQAALIKAQAKQEIEVEKNQNSHELDGNNGHGNGTKGKINPDKLAVSGVYFTCPLIGPELLSKQLMEESIQNYLFQELIRDKTEKTACVVIHSCNKPLEKVNNCVETLCKYLNNIIEHPSEEKYRRIRCQNKVYQEKVYGVLGAEQFLLAVGFERSFQKINPADWLPEEMWEFYAEDEESDSFVEDLEKARDLLKTTVPIKPMLDRNIQIMNTNQMEKKVEEEFPDDFYTLSREELKREQELRTERIERELTLRTKEMRERDEQQRHGHGNVVYRYAIIRIRFPDNIVLQGTFGANEKLYNLYEFVRQNLVISDWEFVLVRPGNGGESLTDMSQSLADLKLTPSSILNYRMENGCEDTELTFIKAEILEKLKQQ